MSRLIDADALLGKLKDIDITTFSALIEEQRTVAFYVYCKVCQAIEKMPIIDAVPAWVSVKDRMPEENVPVLVWELQGFAYVDVYKDGVWEVGTPNLAKFTHWMPLPEPPKEVTQDG